MLKTLIKKVNSIKSEYLSRSPKGKWEFVRDTASFFLRLTGVAVLDPNFKVTWGSSSAGIVIIDVTLSFAYTIWYYNFKEIDRIKSTLNIPLYFGVLIPSSFCYIMVLIKSQREMWRSLAYFSGSKIYTNIDQKSNENYIRVCDACAVDLLRSTMITLFIILGSMNIYVGFPVTSSMFSDDLQLPIPVFVPFTDYTTTHGIVLNLINNAFVATVGLAGNVGLEIITSMLKNTFGACTAALEHTLHEITTLLEKPDPKPLRTIHDQFRNCLVQVQDLDIFTLKLSKLYYWKFFLQPIFTMFSVSFSIFLYMFFNWISGIGVALLNYSQMYILCDIGHSVVSANELLVFKFNEMPWYLLTSQQQLCYAHLLNRLQNGATLKMGPFAVLNRETLSDMTNKIYSTLMLLIRGMT